MAWTLPSRALAQREGDYCGGLVAAMARDRLCIESDLREAEDLVSRVRGVSVDDAAQVLKDHADLMRVAVVDVARAVISGPMRRRGAGCLG